MKIRVSYATVDLDFSWGQADLSLIRAAGHGNDAEVVHTPPLREEWIFTHMQLFCNVASVIDPSYLRSSRLVLRVADAVIVDQSAALWLRPSPVLIRPVHLVTDPPEGIHVAGTERISVAMPTFTYLVLYGWHRKVA